MLSYKNLFEVCIEALNDFSADDQSVEEFIKGFMKRRKVDIVIFIGHILNCLFI